MALPEQEPEILTFRTSGLWFAVDLRRLIDAVEQTYGAFRVARTYSHRLAEARGQYEVLYDFLDEFLERDLDRGPRPPIPSELRRLRSLLLYLGWPVAGRPSGEYYNWITNNIDGLDERGRLRLARALISSPGEISFKGTGEIIEQMREFVKDLSGRNRQEREMAGVHIERERTRLRKDQLEIAREYLSTFRAIPPEVLDDLGLKAIDGVSALIELQLEGKLELERGDGAPEEDEPSD